MSWQAFEAVRDHSGSRGAARTVGFVMASYADKYGNGIFLSLDRLMADAKVGRKSAVDGRRWFLENGEAELTERPDGKPLMRGRVQVMSMRPLMERARAAERGSASELIDEGSERAPQPKEGSESALSGVRSGSQGVRSAPPSSSQSEPETEGSRTDTEDESSDARAGARAMIPVYEPERTETQRRAERQELESEIATLRGQLSTARDPDRTHAAIATLETELQAVAA